jgi:hypothetical protein
MPLSDAIARHRTALLGVVAGIVAMLGEGGTITRRLRNAALALLRPAESAARRLILLASLGVEATPRQAPVLSVAPALAGVAGRRRTPAFRLIDRARSFSPLFRRGPPAGVPRIRTFWGPAAALPPPPSVAPASAAPDPDAPVDARRLRQRLVVLARALADLPRQARRLARWRARRVAGPGGRLGSPLRLGHPPGHRRQPGHPVDDLLRTCHDIALEALAAQGPAADTS